MDRSLRHRFLNAVLLTGILFMYAAYDTGFRFWMSQSDASTLTALILRNPAALKMVGDTGISYEAGGAVASAPALQTILYDTHRWTRAAPTSAEKSSASSSHHNRNSPPVSEATKEASGSHGRLSRSSSSDFPMAAVVVESTWLSPDHATVSASYAQRLLEGYRYALLTGAPWLLLAGTAEETSLGLQYLLRLSRPAEALFGNATLTRWPRELTRLAVLLHASMLPYDTLGAWMHEATSKPIPAFRSSTSLSPSPSSLHGGSASAALRYSLNHLLSAASLADTGGIHQHRRPAALVLAAEWLQRSDTALLQKGADGGTAGGTQEPRVTVYATPDTYTAAADDGEDGEAATAAARVNFDEDGDSAESWETARVHLLHLNGTRQAVHFTVPGIVSVTVEDANTRARSAAKALQQLLIKSLAQRHVALAEGRTEDAVDPLSSRFWWWLGRPCGVIVVGGMWEQQRVKLLYIKALRDAAAETRESLRRAVQDVHQARCQFEAAPDKSLLCRGARRTHLPAAALPFAAAVPSPSKVFVLAPAFEETPVVEPQPGWLNFTGELPPNVNAEASRAARAIGRWSFFLYANYRRWVNWFVVSLPGGAYQDHFVLASVLLSDLADRRISWRDVFYLR